MPELEIQSYAGFTIGPIYDVMRYARKTREIWFGSYFFSWYMEKLISELVTYDVRFLTPHAPMDAATGQIIPNRSAGGKYPDRFVLYSVSLPPETLFEIIKTANETTLSYFSKLIVDLAAEEKKRHPDNVQLTDIGGVSGILKNYIQTRFTVLPQNDADVRDAVRILYRHLDSLEDAFIFTPGTSRQTCVRCKTLPSVIRIREFEDDSFQTMHLCPICFVKLRANRLEQLKSKLNQTVIAYPPIQEICAQDLFQIPAIRQRYEEDPEKDILFSDIKRILAREPDPSVFVRPHHKYFAVVQADGDNLTKIAGAIGNPAALSQKLFAFADEAEQTFRAFGGEPIYFGGDDILAFTPVFRGRQSVVDLLSDISELYQRHVTAEKQSSHISFGVNIAYYKFPLSSALEQAASLLFGVAKIPKNAAAFCLTKHSGAQTQFCLPLNSETFRAFQTLLDGVFTETFRIPKGIHHNLSRFCRVIAEIPKNETHRLTSFFENNFNEPVHKDFRAGFDAVVGLISSLLPEVPDRERGIGAVTSALAMLRFIKFLTTEEERS